MQRSKRTRREQRTQLVKGVSTPRSNQDYQDQLQQLEASILARPRQDVANSHLKVKVEDERK